jgi:hypothetical protein
MTINSRRKGKAGEQELINLLKDLLGDNPRKRYRNTPWVTP